MIGRPRGEVPPPLPEVIESVVKDLFPRRMTVKRSGI
jgi:hypothetical protein